MPKVPANAAPYAFRTPPRCRWLLRFTAAYVLLSAALVGLWFWWDANSRARLDAKIAALKAAGEPTRAEDFDLVDVPDELNAARALADANAAMVPALGPNLPTVSEFFASEPVLASGFLAELDWLIDTNQPALCLLREARGLHAGHASQFKDYYGYAWVYDAEQLAEIAMAAAIRAHLHADDEQSIEFVRDALAIPRILSVYEEPNAEYQERARRIDILICELLGKIAAELQPDQPTSEGGTPSGDIIALIAQLRDETGLSLELRCALEMTRGSAIEWTEDLLKGKEPWSRYAVRPLWGPFNYPTYRVECCEMLDYLNACCIATDAADWPTASRRIGDDALAGLPYLIRWHRTYARDSFGLSGSGYSVQKHFERLAMRRMAAAALAIRLHELDHGVRPEKLADLVPNYLPDVPADPYLPDRRPLGYRLDGGARLYSAGEDMIDDGGEPQEWPRQEVIMMLDDQPNFRVMYLYPLMIDDARD